MLTSIALAAIIAATSVAAACIALMILSSLSAMKDGRPRLADLPSGTEPAVFLFDDRELVDATAPALRILGLAGRTGGEWERLLAYLAQRFGDVGQALSELAAAGVIERSGRDDPSLHFRAEFLSGLARITVSDLGAEGHGVIVDSLCQRAQNEELAMLRDLAENLPVVSWHQRPDGNIDWGNRAYLDLVAQRTGVRPYDQAWPLTQIFDPDRLTAMPQEARLSLPDDERQSLRWFEHHQRPASSGTVHYALPADALVRAETAQREFVQTLTKTFAHLPIGLAIFDRQRRLTLFNPALVDLTGLVPEFLLARPTLFAVLDRMREMRMVPEPKDYHGWRNQMAALERAAASGFHQETWSLASGQTYRVTGRPHPEGAVAFLLEDISAEISLTRRFRAEIELGQEIVNTLDEAMAIFSPAGVLVQSNTAYARLWGIDPGATLRAVTIRDSCRHWQAMTLPDSVWTEVADFVSGLSGRKPATHLVTLKDGAALSCRCVPLSGGATLIGFSRGIAGDRPETRRIWKVRRPTLLAGEMA